MRKIILGLTIIFAANIGRAELPYWNAWTDTTFYIGAWIYPNGSGSPGLNYQVHYQENPDSARQHGFNAIWVNYYTTGMPDFFHQAKISGLKVMLHGVKDPANTNVNLHMIGAGQSSAYECEANSYDADAGLTAPNYYYVNCAGRDTFVADAAGAFGGKNAKLISRDAGLSQGRVVNGVKARFPAYQGQYPCNTDNWFNKDIKEQESPQPGNPSNLGGQFDSLPYYATFRIKRTSGPAAGSAVVCTLSVEVRDDATDTLLLPAPHTWHYNTHIDPTHWYKILTLDSLPLDSFCEKTVQFYKDTASIYDVDGKSLAGIVDPYDVRPLIHSFRYSLSWVDTNSSLVLDRIQVEDTLGRGVRTNDSLVYASLNRMKNDIINNIYPEDFEAYGGSYITDEVHADAYGTYNKVNEYFKDALGGINFTNMTYVNIPYCYWSMVTGADQVPPADASRSELFCYKNFLDSNPENAYCPALAFHINIFGPVDSMHNHSDAVTEFNYQNRIRIMADLFKAARSVGKAYNRELYFNVQANDWLMGNGAGYDVWSRLPTPEEIKVQVYQALCYGVKGIGYYYYASDSGGYSGSYVRGLKHFNSINGTWYCTPQMYAVDTINSFIHKNSTILKKAISDEVYQIDDLQINSDTTLNNGIIKGISAPSSVLYMDVGLFTYNNEKLFMLVNRKTTNRPGVWDTSRVTVKVNYGQPYFISDCGDDKPVTGQLPAGENEFTVLVKPGEGRLFRIVPFTAQIKINQNAAYTNFKFVQVDDPASSSLHSVDSVQITQKYYVKTPEDTAARPDYIDYYWAANTSAWLPYSASSIKYLENSIDNKANVFELQFKIGGGKILTPKYSSQIFFNDVSPVNGAITINNNANFTNSQTVNVKLSGTDLFPGLSQMRFGEAPFGNDSGYANLVKNGTFADSTNWVLDNAEFYDGFLHLKGYHTGPGPAQIGSSAKQVIPGSELNAFKGKLLRLCDDIYAHDILSSYKIVDVFYADTLYPNFVRLLEKTIASDPEVVWRSQSDTFTLKVDTSRSIDRMEISYNIWDIEVPPNPPDPGTLFNTIVVDNICLEPVELKTGAQPDAIPPVSYYIYDGWDYADTAFSWSYKLSDDDGTKRVYMQLSDLAGNIGLCPGWSDTIVLDMTAPMAGITSPVDMSYVNGTISIRGYAWDVHFANWVLEFKKNNSETWSSLSNGITPIHYKFPQTLCLWNTETLNDGLYLLRQTGYDRAGNCKSETIYVYVANDVLPREAVTADFAVFNSLPVDGTVDAEGNIYATDTQADKIWKFSPDGDSMLCFGYKYTCTDTLGFNHPKGIAVGDSGCIWVTDCYQSKIKKYDGRGNYISTIGKHGNKAGEFNQPTGIVIKDNYIYVADHLNNRVQVFNKAGVFVRQFGANILKQPTGIAIWQNEDSYLIYVSDSKNNRIAIFDTLGKMVDSLGAGLDLREPWDICFDCNNNLYIADVYNNRIIQLDVWGNKLLTFGTQGKEAGEFKLPQGLAVSPDGKYVYVIDTHNDRIQRFKMFIDIGTGGPQLAGKRKKAPMPLTYILGQSYPNPWKQTTSINYQIANAGNVSLKVYNTLGQVVKTMINQNHLPGYYSVKWDGKDDNDRKVSSGIYFYRIVSGEFSDTKKMIVLK